MNILFLGGAKRVSMARKFKAAARKLGLEAHIYSYELSAEQPIACEADEIIIGKRWSDPALNADLRRIIADKQIDVVIPFVDGAVAPACRLKDVAFVPAPSAEVAELMFDKLLCDKRLRECGLPVPSSEGERYIAKPRHGSASKGILIIDDPTEVSAEQYLIQELIDPRREITVDCYVEPSSGRICACVPRERLEVSGGEVTRSRTLARPELVAVASDVLQRLDLQGAITVQLLEDLRDGRIMVMEINPRLGGGCVCSVGAGADIPLMILRNALGREADCAPDYKIVEIARYPDEVIFPQ